MQTEKVEESLKHKKGYIPKQAFSFLKYMMAEKEEESKKGGKKKK